MKLLTNMCLAAFLMGLLCAQAGAGTDKDVALVLKTRGKVGVAIPNSKKWRVARRGVRLDSGQKIRTGEGSLAALVFTDDKSLLKVRPNSTVTIEGKREKEGIVKRISLAFGEIWAKVTRQKTRLRVETPSGVATVKGTEFSALYSDGEFFVFCQEGLMELFNQFGTMALGANEMARLVQGSPPERIEGDPNDIFDLSDDEIRQLEIEFEDEDGNKKKLILEFE